MHDHLTSGQPKKDIVSPKKVGCLQYSLQTENVISCVDIGKNKQTQILIAFVGSYMPKNKLLFGNECIYPCSSEQ